MSEKQTMLGETEAKADMNPDIVGDATDLNTYPMPTGPIMGLAILGSIALLVLMAAGLRAIQTVFAPIFLALTIALAFRPIGQWILRKGVPAWLAATTMIVSVVGFILAVAGILVASLTPVPATFMRYSANFEEMTARALDWVQERGVETQDISVYLNQLNFSTMIGYMRGLVDYVTSVGGFIMVVVVAIFFITIDTMTVKARGKIVRISHSHLAQSLESFEARVRQYWIVSTVFGIIVAVIDGLGLQMMGIPLAWTWAFWAFITNYIPNIGFVIGIVPPMLMALLDQGVNSMIWVAVLYTVANVVIQTFIQPKFTGDAVGLSTIVTFISLVVWTLVVGVLGSILAVPLTLFFKALLVDSDPRTRWIDAFLISEEEARRRNEDGHYDVDSPADDDFREFRNPFAGSSRRPGTVRSGQAAKLTSRLASNRLKVPKRPRKRR